MASRLPCLLLASLFTLPAFSQTSSLAGVARDARSFQQERRADRVQVRAAEDRTTKYQVSVGAGYTKLDDAGHQWTTPFALSATTPEGTTFKISGDGYARSSDPAGTSDGLADVELMASRRFFTETNFPLRLGIGLKVATGGSAGTDSDALFLSGSYRKEVPVVGRGTHGYALSGKIKKDINNVPDGVDPFVMSGSLMYDYAFAEGRDLGISGWFAQLGRAKRVDASGVTFAVVGVERPVNKVWSAELSVYRGLTRGARDTALEISLSRDF